MRLPVDPVYPIKHVCVYRWEFGEAKSLNDVAARLEKHHYCVSPRDDMLVITTPAKPTVVIVMIQRDEKGGELIVVNMDKYYTRTKVEQGVWMFQNRAGISVVDLKYA